MNVNWTMPILIQTNRWVGEWKWLHRDQICAICCCVFTTKHVLIHQWSRNLFLAGRKKMSGRPTALCRTFWAPVRHFSQLMTGTYQWSFLFSLPDILCVLNPAGQNVRHILRSLIIDTYRYILIHIDTYWWTPQCYSIVAVHLFLRPPLRVPGGVWRWWL